MNKLSFAATLILISCACIPIIDFRNMPSIIASTHVSYSQNSTAIAQIYIQHNSVSDLVVSIGVGDPNGPQWSSNVWNRQSGISNLNLTIDISPPVQYLPPLDRNRFFLEVFDAVNGNQGQIEKFTIIYNNQTFDSMSVPISIYDFEKSYSYIPGVPLELAMSRRVSIRAFPQTENYTLPAVPSDLLLKVLWAGYGASSSGRTTSNICGNHPLILYVCNKTAVYTYNPAQQTLELFKNGDYRFSEQWWLGYPGPGTHPAPVELFIALDTNKFADLYFGAMEAGTVVQNIYLEANSLGLGTVCVGGVNATLIHTVLDLPANEVVLLNMPLGYPTPAAFYNFTYAEPTASTLPRVQQSSVFLDSALMDITKSHDWSNALVTRQEMSQILWSAYGRSYLEDLNTLYGGIPYQHRTTASAGGDYPLKIWLMNSTGTFLYWPWNNDISFDSSGDKRTALGQATESSWITSSPMTLLIVLNTTQMDQGRRDWAYTEIGSAIQNVFLEGAAWGLVADWSRIMDENAAKTILGIAGYTDLRPVIAITVGHPLVRGDINYDGVVDIFDAIMLSTAYNSVPGSARWNPDADLNSDNIVDIFDAIILSNNFGKKT